MEENVKNDKDALVIIIFPLVAQNPLTRNCVLKFMANYLLKFPFL